jgi:Tol biopolymer transport system component
MSSSMESVKEIPDYSCDYLGEEIPDSIPKIFAKNLVSTQVDESSFEINKNGDEMIFAREGKIMILTKKDTGWIGPQTANFSGTHIDGECCFAPTGDKIYFASRRFLQGAEEPLNTWVSEKVNDKWQDPFPVKEPLFHQTTHAVSVASSGNLYCSGIDLYEFSGNQYLPVVPADAKLKGSHPFIAPDESYILFCKRAEGRQDPDIYISFQQEGSWSDPLPLNEHINTTGLESNPFVTPDGKYLFFIRWYDVYWVEFNIEKI